MNQYDVWEYEFDDHILKRGRKYADLGRIEFTDFDDGVFYGKARGTDLYDVEVKMFEDGTLSPKHCSCPYYDNGRNCKHLAAAIYTLIKNPESAKMLIERAIEDREYELERDEALKKTIDSADPKDLKDFIFSVLKEDQELFDRFIYTVPIEETVLLYDTIDEEIGLFIEKLNENVETIENIKNPDFFKETYEKDYGNDFKREIRNKAEDKLRELGDDFKSILNHLQYVESLDDSDTPTFALHLTMLIECMKPYSKILNQTLIFSKKNVDIIKRYYRDASDVKKESLLNTILDYFYVDDKYLHPIISRVVRALLGKAEQRRLEEDYKKTSEA